MGGVRALSVMMVESVSVPEDLSVEEGNRVEVLSGVEVSNVQFVGNEILIAQCQKAIEEKMQELQALLDECQGLREKSI